MMSFTRGPSLDELLSSTLDNYGTEYFNQWARGNVIAKKLMDAGNVKTVDGGNDIVEGINYQSGGNVAWISRTDPVGITQNQELCQATFSFAMLGGSVVIYDYEEAQNTGKNKLVDLLETRLENVKEEMSQSFQAAALASSTANANTVWSLYDIVDASNPSLANYGQIDRASYTWWQATETASGSFASQGLEDMRTASNTVSKDGLDQVNLYVTTQTIHEYYAARMVQMEQIVSREKGDAEFNALAFQGKPLVFAYGAQSGTLLGLNLKYMKLVVNKNMRMRNYPFVRTQAGQSKAAQIKSQMQIVCTKPGANFKLTGITA